MTGSVWRCPEKGRGTVLCTDPVLTFTSCFLILLLFTLFSQSQSQDAQLLCVLALNPLSPPTTSSCSSSSRWSASD